MQRHLIAMTAAVALLAGGAFWFPELRTSYLDTVHGELPTVTQTFADDARINSRQAAKVTLTYLGPDHDGNHRFRITSEGSNGYREKGNTFRIATVLKNEQGEPLYAHIQHVGVNARYLKRNHTRNSRSFDVLLSDDVARQLASIEVSADNKGNTRRMEKALRDAVGDGILKGIKDGIAELVKKGMVSVA